MPNDNGTQTIAELQAELALIRARIVEVRAMPIQYSVNGTQVMHQQLAVLRKEETIILERLQRAAGGKANISRVDMSEAFQ